MPKKVVYHSQIINGSHTIDAHNRKLRDDYIAQLIESKWNGCIEHTIRKSVKPKSNQQVKMIFGHMIEKALVYLNDKSVGIEAFLQFLIDNKEVKGVPVDKDYLHALMYQICPTFNENGERVTLSQMSTEQANELFERFRNIMGAFGCDIKDPNPNWRKEK